MQKYLFIDRDGTILQSPPPGGQIDSFEKLHFYPHVITWLGKIARELPFKLVMVTNQNGLNSPMYPTELFYPTQNFMLEVLKNEDIHFEDIIIFSLQFKIFLKICLFFYDKHIFKVFLI